MRGELSKFLRCCFERMTGQLSDCGRHLLCITRRCIDTSAYRRATEFQLSQIIESIAQCLDAIIELCDKLRKFLAERQWGCIHQMGLADFDDLHESSLFLRKQFP